MLDAKDMPVEAPIIGLDPQGEAQKTGHDVSPSVAYSGKHPLHVRRAYCERLYSISPLPPASLDDALEHFSSLSREQAEAGEEITRSVYRAIVDAEVAEAAVMRANRGLRRSIEVAFPLDAYDMPGSWFVSMAQNDTGRQAIRPIPELKRSLKEQQDLVAEAPLKKVREAVGRGFHFTDRIEDYQVDRLQEIWGDTFDWTTEQVEQLKDTLKNEVNLPPHERTLWFTGLIHDGKLAAASMAAKTEIPGTNGRNLHYVESTEWSNPTFETKGSMAAVLAVLNAQVLESIPRDEKPFIFAETNLSSGAHRTGHAAGFQSLAPRIEIANVHIPISQILVQNVTVGDGQDIPAKYRDFGFMVLSPEAVRVHYRQYARQEMLSYIR